MDKTGNIGVIRDGNIILEPLYKEVTIYEEYNNTFLSNNYEKKLDYLFVVSDGKFYGICSSKGKLVLPIKYSLIDVNENFLVILEQNNTIEAGYYEKYTETFKHSELEIKDGVVFISDDYVWDGCFRYLDDSEYPGWTEQELRDAADAAYEGHSRLYLGLED